MLCLKADKNGKKNGGHKKNTKFQPSLGGVEGFAGFTEDSQNRDRPVTVLRILSKLQVRREIPAGPATDKEGKPRSKKLPATKVPNRLQKEIKIANFFFQGHRACFF